MSSSARDSDPEHNESEQSSVTAGCSREGTVPAGVSRRTYRTVSVLLAISALFFAVSALMLMCAEEPVGWEDREYTEGNLTINSGLHSEYITMVSAGGEPELEYTGPGSDVEWLSTDLSDTDMIAVGDHYEFREATRSYDNTISFQEPGEYEVVLFVDGSVVAAGRAVVDGEIQDKYEWSRFVDGDYVHYGITFTYMFEEYQRYAEESAVRHAQSGMSDGRFAVVDDAIMRLADALADEYEAVYGPDAQRNGQDYADYLLSFVQFAIQYPIELEYEDGKFVPVSGGNGDLYLYGTEEYWAYPMETLYHRMGDCEDTSFLLASLYSASGYTSSTIRVSGHMVVGVELDLFEPDGFYANHLRVSDVTLDGTHLWLCETSYDQYVPVGLLNIKSDLETSDIRQYAFVAPVVTTKGAASA